ncbi:DedA family protein [Candidatus Woesearchaeota archaeon]|nr:DedA family protein [Candidatus Woesearchaeota archaeon]
MELINKLIEIFLHLDKNLASIIQTYGLWTYLILFLIIFMETGFVATPFLPGDSLIFAAGALAAYGSLNVILLFFLLVTAAILGDTVNYWIGYFIGPRVFREENIRFFRKEYLDKTHKFYEKYGGKTIIMARFIPIIRTFAPFVAGIGKMSYWKFISYNVIGGVLWVGIFVFGGYYFGNLTIVKENFTLVLLFIILASFIPAIIEFIKYKYRERKIKDERIN